MQVKRPEPIARGEFAQTPFAHILVYIMNRQLSGTLEIQEFDDLISIYFRHGMPSKVTTTLKGKHLGQVLLDLGIITQEQLLISQRQLATKGGLQGELLMELGFIRAQELVTGITRQMALKMVDAFAMPKGQYAFYEKVNLLIGSGPAEMVQLDTLALLIEGIMTHGQTLNLDPVLGTLSDRLLYLDDPKTLTRFNLSREMRMVCRQLLERPRRFSEFFEGNRFEPHMVRTLLYVFAITKILRTAEFEKEDSGEIQLSSARFDSIVPPPERAKTSYTPEVTALRAEIQNKAAHLSTQNYYQMLEIPQDATAEDARKAFFKMARLYHPDKSSRPEFSDLQQTLAFLFANLSEAHSTIIDPDAREEYDAAILAGQKRKSSSPPATDTGAETAEEREVRDALEAETSFQKGLVLMRREQYEKAWELIHTAHELCVNEPEYTAADCYLQIVMRREKPDKLIPLMREAAKNAPKSERVRLFFAHALKAANMSREAKEHYEAVVEINPHNIEAARVLRLMNMRKSDEPPKGLFSRFLK